TVTNSIVLQIARAYTPAPIARHQRSSTQLTSLLINNAGALVTRAWNSKLSKTGTHYVLTPESYNTTIAPGSSVTVGFQAAQTSTYSAPANCQLNGESCGDGPAPTASVRH
uniref:cellulose binding domain-containing protein n=1 Tax=Mycobacterium pseudoshottsii TaxID=265949 RepID=UPI003FD827D5